MIESLEIENFRPFRKLELSGLKRVNIIVGDNGSGKTAFLEAIFLAAGSNPQVGVTLRQWRGLEAATITTSIDIYDAIWINLFSNYDREKIINIRLHGSKNDSRSLSVFYKKDSTITLPLTTNGYDTPRSTYVPVALRWKAPDSDDVELTMRSTGAGLQIEGVIRESNLRSAFIPAHAQTSNQYTAVLYSNLSKENKEGDFVAAIRKQFPAIEKVSVELEAGASAVFVSVPGLSRKIPLALFSNAASNLASILLNIAGSSHGIVCVDEIENGFHYTKYHRVWDQIRTFANDFETQIFASTHSAECLRVCPRS
jgi:predicted ATPase